MHGDLFKLTVIYNFKLLNPVSITKSTEKSGCEGKRKITGIVALPSIILP